MKIFCLSNAFEVSLDVYLFTELSKFHERNMNIDFLLN